MRVFLTKLPDKDAEKFEEACRRIGKSCYEVLRELIYRWLSEHGVEVENAPIELRLSEIERKLREIKEEQKMLREQVNYLKQEIERLSKAGLLGFMGNKKR